MKPLNKVAAFIAIAVVVMFALLRCEENKNQIHELENKVSILTIGNQKLKTEVDSKGWTIAEQKADIMYLTKSVEEYIKENTGLKNAKAYVKVQTVTRIDSVLVPYEKPIYLTVGDSSAVLLPVKLKYQDTDLSLQGTLKKSGFLIDSMKVQANITLGIGDSKTKWYKPKETVVRAKTDSKYVTITGMNNIVVKHEKRWYEKPVFWGAVGFGVGGFVTYKLTK